MNKKGLDAKVLVELLLVVAGLVILLLVYKQISSGVKGGTDSEICRDSVLTTRVSKFIGVGKPTLDLKCKTKSKIIEGDNEKIKTELTKDIYDCSYQYWDGKLDFTNFWESVLSQKNYCFVCYIETSSNEFKISAQDLSNQVAKAGNIKELLLEGDAKTIFLMNKNEDLLVSFYIAKISTGMQAGVLVGKPEDLRKKCEVYIFS